MKLLSALLLSTSLLTFSGPADVAEREVERGTVEVGEIEVRDWQPLASPLPDAEPKRVVTQHNLVVSVPGDCLEGANRYDLLVHFHGNPLLVEKGWHAAGVRSVLATVNLGPNTKAYTQAYHYENAFENLSKLVHRYVQRMCPNLDGGSERVAVSAWSGGYAAVQRLVRRGELADRIDAVLLSDGLHASLTNRWPRNMSTLGLEPFVEFAERAAQGEKLFALTHTAIKTTDYASTTETADHLLEQLGLVRLLHVGRSDEPLSVDSSAKRGAFSVQGFTGENAKAHATQLKSLGQTLFSRLARRWRGVRPEAP